MNDPVELPYDDDEAYAEVEDYEELLAPTVQPPRVKRTKVTAVPVIVDDSEGLPFWQYLLFGAAAGVCWFYGRALGRIVLSIASRFTDYLGDDVPEFDAKEFIGVLFVSVIGYCIHRFALSGGRVMTTEAAQVEADARAEALGYQIVNYIPILSLAVGILKFLSTAAALYLVFLIVVNLELLLFVPLVIKQRAYSYFYKELATPRVGPVFLTQIKQAGFILLDGVLAPWSWLPDSVKYFFFS